MDGWETIVRCRVTVGRRKLRVSFLSDSTDPDKAKYDSNEDHAFPSGVAASLRPPYRVKIWCRKGEDPKAKRTDGTIGRHLNAWAQRLRDADSDTGYRRQPHFILEFLLNCDDRRKRRRFAQQSELLIQKSVSPYRAAANIVSSFSSYILTAHDVHFPISPPSPTILPVRAVFCRYQTKSRYQTKDHTKRDRNEKKGSNGRNQLVRFR